MSPKNMSKKPDKQNRNKQGKDGKRTPVLSGIIAPRPMASTPGVSATVTPTLITSSLQPTLKTVRASGENVRTLKKWCIDQTPVYFTPDQLKPALHLNRGTIVELTGEKQTLSTDVKTSWSEIVYRKYEARAGIQWVTGWVKDAYLDEYNEKFPDAAVIIPNATEDPKDAQQYMMLESKVRYNLCGELCVALIVNDNIDSVLAKWKTNSLSSFSSILAGGRDNTTSENDLKNMLGAVLSEYGYGSDSDQMIFFREKLTFPVTPLGMQEDLKKMLATHYLIVLVTISKSEFGGLVGKDHPVQTLHWVVLDKITRNGNRLTVYNPYPNKWEEYSFGEFFNSCRSSWSGIWVKRKKARPMASVEALPKFEVPIANPNPAYGAKQYIDVEGKKQTNLCGEFCVSFVANKSINKVLEDWKEIQPKVYADIIGNNKTTGSFELVPILRGYGYNNPGDVMSFDSGLTDPDLKRSLPSPGRIAKMLQTHWLIAGVGINNITGQLKPGGTRHWVVVDKITPVGTDDKANGGWVEIYNPFMNRWEEYSYREFIHSVGVVGMPPLRLIKWSGMWVKRNIVPKFVPPVVQEPRSEDEDQEPGPMNHGAGKLERWLESRLRLEIEKLLQIGRPKNKIIAELSKPKASGWKKSDIAAFVESLRKTVRTKKEWSEAQMHGAIEKRLHARQPVNNIVAELFRGTSGWKKSDIAELAKKLKKTVKVPKLTNEELIAAIKKFQNTKSPVKILAELAETSGWKKPEISKVLKTVIPADTGKRKKGGKSKLSLLAEPPWAFTVEPKTIIQASKPWDEYRAWQDSILKTSPNVYRVQRWGEPIMVAQGGFSVVLVNTTNFQAVKLWSPEAGWGGVADHHLKIPHDHVRNLAAMQLNDEFVAKESGRNEKNDMEQWLVQKMSWLCKDNGTIYMRANEWKTVSFIRWGTIALGGNLVSVEGRKTVILKLPNETVKRKVEMVRLKGFRKYDWSRPLDELLAEGLVHRCFCAYSGDSFGDTPKGIVYSPLFSPRDWEGPGKKKPKAFYIPMDWLEPKGP